jgi:predicted 2-oxoglutarate/Fe(II)-dependent dioxygenase YbiX
MSSGLTRGDRIPDYKRLNHLGEPRMLYDLQIGQPMTLLVFDNVNIAEISAAIAAYSSDDPVWAHITRVALIKGSPEECKHSLGNVSDVLTVLMDDGAVSTALLGSEPADRGLITAFVMDSNLRVIERIEYKSEEDLFNFLQNVKAIYQNTAPHDPKLIHMCAPVLFIPRVFDNEVCEELITLFEKDGGQPSGIAHIAGNKALWRPDPSVKIRRDVYIKESIMLERIKSILIKRVLSEIKRCFNYQVTQHEVFKLVRYDSNTGGYFRPHRDNETRDTLHRRFAMTLNLNTGDYRGGQLRFPEFGTDLYQPELGGAVVFSSSLLHEVLPIATGSRYALLGFFFGENESIAQMQYQDTTSHTRK